MSRKTWEGKVPFVVVTQEAIDQYKRQHAGRQGTYWEEFLTTLRPGVEMCRELGWNDQGEVMALPPGPRRTEMRVVQPFYAGLRYTDWYQGRSKVGVILQDEATRIYYPMAMQLFDEYLKMPPSLDGELFWGTWRVVKLNGGYFSLAADGPAS